MVLEDAAGMNSRFLILLVIIAFPLNASRAQQRPPSSASGSRTISRTVVSPSGAVIPAAEVALTPLGGSVIDETRTDDTGSFRFERLNAGKYLLVVRAAGFLNTKTEVSLGAKAGAKIRIPMAIATQGGRSP